MKTRAELDEIYKKRMRRQRLGRILKGLHNIDPHPWHQSVLLGIAFAVLILMCLFGNYVDELQPSTRIVQEMEL